ncbi:MAG: SDR family oxidoreductase [Halalkalicoccus sp.]|nr:SDR family oxidoreductase [Halalkalicoccus sp.]
MASVLLTPANGTVSSATGEALSARGVGFRAGVRNPVSYEGGGNPVAFDFEKPETWGRAFDGIESLFLVRPPTVEIDRIREAAAAASRCGVESVVYLSVLGADRNPLLPHRRIERHLEGLPVATTFLRASFFMQNVDEVHARWIHKRDEVFVPAGGGETSFVDARDVGTVAATCVSEPDHEGRAYDLTGPEALDYYEVAAILSAELDRPISYAAPSPWVFARHELAAGTPLALVLVMLGIYTTARLGLAGRVTDDVERVLGRPPRSFEEYAADYREAFE